MLTVSVMYERNHLSIYDQPFQFSTYQQRNVGGKVQQTCSVTCTSLKGSLTRDFRLQVFFMNQCPPGPQVPSNRVISSSFSHTTFFSQNFMKVPFIFFLAVNSLNLIFEFFQNSQRYSRFNVYHRCQQHQ